MELPLPQELKSLIQEYASDRIGIHPTAHLMHTLRMFELCKYQCFKIVMCDFESGDLFTVLREGQMVRVCDRFYHYKKGGMFTHLVRAYDLHW